MGLAEVMIALALVAFGGIGVDQKAKSPKLTEVARYAPEDADYMGFWNVQAVLPGAMKELSSLPEQPLLAAFPEIQREVGRIVRDIDQAVTDIRQNFAFDPIKDVHWMGGWLRIGDDGDPDFLIAIAGHFPEGFLRKLVGGDAVTVAGRPGFRMPGFSGAVVVRDGNIIVGGTERWVGQRLAAAGPSSRDSITGRAAGLFKSRPHFVVASRPSATLKAGLIRQLTGKDEIIIRDLLTRHTFAGLAATPRGIELDHLSDTADDARAVAMGVEGAFDLLRAGQYATRGFVRLFLAGLHSYDEVHPRWARILKHERLILELVWRWTGDGKFKTRVTQKGRRVQAEARAKRLSEVIPAIGVAAVVGAGMYYWLALGHDSAAPEPADEAPATAPKTQRRGRTRGLEKRPATEPTQVQPIPTP